MDSGIIACVSRGQNDCTRVLVEIYTSHKNFFLSSACAFAALAHYSFRLTISIPHCRERSSDRSIAALSRVKRQCLQAPLPGFLRAPKPIFIVRTFVVAIVAAILKIESNALTFIVSHDEPYFLLRCILPINSSTFDVATDKKPIECIRFTLFYIPPTAILAFCT